MAKVAPERTVTFSGHSDDIFNVDTTGPYVDGEPDEIGSYSTSAHVRLKGPKGEGLNVMGAYAACGEAVWTIGIAPLDEDLPLPAWPMRWSFEGYSTVLEIDLPADVSIENFDPDAA